MATIPLRTYVREINNLIDQRNVQEAIEHCKHILNQYPKHLDTYRLLGQAYLDLGQYQEASDIFLRVLSVLPDDFISHLGLSVINESDNNLDASIWHMERAYEIRSTEAIHEELQRLFSMRDGIAPPKPHITRGSLIRINIRSGLYQQALAEIQRALQEDPQRLDLLILRARIYFLQNNLTRSVETCKQVLEKLPYSYDANSLMAEIFGSTEKSAPFKQRLQELDPYTKYVSSSISIDQVSDESVQLDRLELHEMVSIHNEYPYLEEEPVENEDHAESAEKTILNYPEPEEETSSSTFFVVEKDNALVEDYPQESESSTLIEDAMAPHGPDNIAEENDDDLLPDWLKEAGWENAEALPAEEEQLAIQSYDELIEQEETLAESEIEALSDSEIPDWLKSVSPEIQTEETTEVTDQDEVSDLAWLNEILSTPEEEIPEPILPTSENEPNEQIADLSIFAEEVQSDLDWLESPDDSLNHEPEEVFELPEELRDFVGENSIVHEANDAVSTYEPLENDIAQELVSADSGAVESSPGEDAGEFDLDSALAWLEGLAAKQGADEDTLSTTPEERIETAPEFLEHDDHDNIPLETTDIMEDMQSETMINYVPEQEAVPDWLQNEEVETIADLGDSIPDWLKNVSPPEHVSIDSTDQIVDETTTIPDTSFVDASTLEESTLDDVEFLALSGAGHPEEIHSTAALDFLKENADTSSLDDIDQWLEKLPEIDWAASDEPVQIEFQDDQVIRHHDTTAPQIENPPQVDGEALELAEDDTQFIEELFTDESSLNDTAVDSEAGVTPPYVWEQEFENQKEPSPQIDLPDWIADIPDIESSHIKGKISEDLIDEEALPDWIARPMDEEGADEFSEEISQMILADDQDESIFIRKEDTVKIPIKDLVEVSSDSLPPSPPEKIESIVVKETTAGKTEPLTFNKAVEADFDLAKQQLAEGKFVDAHSSLRKFIENGENLDQVINTLLFDVEHYHPIEVDSWVLLGDAYLKKGDLSKALDAYVKAEDFVN